MSLFQSKSELKVFAFHMHSFLLYNFNPITKQTHLHLLLTQKELIFSSIQERLMQILQLLQGKLTSSAELSIDLTYLAMDQDLFKSYQILGFTKMVGKESIHLKNRIIQLSCFTNRLLWAPYGIYISLPSQPLQGSDTIVKFEPCKNSF